MIRAAQLLLMLSAAGLWVASRLSWVSVTSSDGLGPERTSTLTGAAWSTALLPLAVLLLAAALAALAVRGWLLRAVAILVAVSCLALGYLGVSLLVLPDIGPRGAELAGVPVADLVASGRQPAGAVVTLLAAAFALAAAVLLMRAAVSAAHRTAKYAAAGQVIDSGSVGLSERGMWDALDDGRDPTDHGADAPRAAGSDTEGR
ncbi:MAG: TIGR02234 family membrane protein [Mycobacterium sp.]